MTILAVDDKKEALKRIEGIVAELRPDAELFTFTSSLDALAKARDLAANPGSYTRATSYGAAKYVKKIDTF